MRLHLENLDRTVMKTNILFISTSRIPILLSHIPCDAVSSCIYIQSTGSLADVHMGTCYSSQCRGHAVDSSLVGSERIIAILLLNAGKSTVANCLALSAIMGIVLRLDRHLWLTKRRLVREQQIAASLKRWLLSYMARKNIQGLHLDRLDMVDVGRGFNEQHWNICMTILRDLPFQAMHLLDVKDAIDINLQRVEQLAEVLGSIPTIQVVYLEFRSRAICLTAPIIISRLINMTFLAVEDSYRFHRDTFAARIPMHFLTNSLEKIASQLHGHHGLETLQLIGHECVSALLPVLASISTLQKVSMKSTWYDFSQAIDPTALAGLVSVKSDLVLTIERFSVAGEDPCKDLHHAIAQGRLKSLTIVDCVLGPLESFAKALFDSHCVFIGHLQLGGSSACKRCVSLSASFPREIKRYYVCSRCHLPCRRQAESHCSTVVLDRDTGDDDHGLVTALRVAAKSPCLTSININITTAFDLTTIGMDHALADCVRSDAADKDTSLAGCCRCSALKEIAIACPPRTGNDDDTAPYSLPCFLEALITSYSIQKAHLLVTTGPVQGGSNPWNSDFRNCVDCLVRLNRAGRGDYVKTDPRNKPKALALMELVTDDLNGIYYLVRANPALCLL